MYYYLSYLLEKVSLVIYDTNSRARTKGSIPSVTFRNFLSAIYLDILQTRQQSLKKHNPPFVNKADPSFALANFNLRVMPVLIG